MNLQQYREIHSKLKEALSDFESNLPDDYTIVGGQIQENKKVLFVTLGSYNEDENYVKQIVFEPKDVTLFRKDLTTLIQGIHVEHYENTLVNLQTNERMTHEISYVSMIDPEFLDEEVVIAKPELFKSEEFLNGVAALPENEPYHSLLLHKLIANKISIHEEDIISNIITKGINNSEIMGEELERVALVRKEKDCNEDSVIYLIAFGEMSLSDYQDYKSDIKQHNISYIRYF